MYRIEYDLIGPCKVPANVYYGAQTFRAIENFSISGRKVHPVLVESIVEIKKAAALIHQKASLLDPTQAEAMIQACDDLLDGQCRNDICVDAIQGGAGTSTNMNVNEVIANRALEIMGLPRGSYHVIHPNDHVNMSQSTNDVYPTAARMTILKLLPKLEQSLDELINILAAKARQFDGILKLGRTQLSDAVPIRLGQEFSAWKQALVRDQMRLRQIHTELSVVNLGGTAIGTCINADPRYLLEIIPTLNKLSGLALSQATDLIDATQNLDSILSFSAILRGLSISLSKMSSDLRLLSSGPTAGIGELNLPVRQNGSSIMPGKVNPVIPEVINQIAFLIIGHDMTAVMAVESGQLELNAFEPVLFDNLFADLGILANGLDTLIRNCIVGIESNPERCRDLLDHSAALATALCPMLGYQKSAEIAKRVVKERLSIQIILEQENLIAESKRDQVLDAKSLTSLLNMPAPLERRWLAGSSHKSD